MAIVTPWVKFWFYGNVWGAKYSFTKALLKFNTVDFSFCWLAEWFLDVAKIEIFAEVEVNECYWGLINAIDGSEDAI